MTDSLAVIPADDQHPFHITPMGLEAKRTKVSFETWEQFGLRLRQVEAALQWSLGDWLLWGEAHYGEDFSQAIDHLYWNPRTIMNYTRVSQAFPLALRTHPLSFSHYQCVMGLPLKVRESLLGQAVKEGWNRTVLREKVREVKGHVPRGKMDRWEVFSEFKERPRVKDQFVIMRTNHLIKGFGRWDENA